MHEIELFYTSGYLKATLTDEAQIKTDAEKKKTEAKVEAESKPFTEPMLLQIRAESQGRITKRKVNSA